MWTACTALIDYPANVVSTNYSPFETSKGYHWHRK